MKIPMGFVSDENKSDLPTVVNDDIIENMVPKKSIVQVYFPSRNASYAYYNDKFDLHCGDIVYVDGKLEGKQGRVVNVTYSFKIKLSDYKRVTAVASTNVKGEFYMTESHMITFDKTAMPYKTALLWFKAPEKDDEEFVCECDGYSFPLNDLSAMKITKDIAMKGDEYYRDGSVCYICLDNNHGNAIVEGNEYYEVEFDYDNGKVSNLMCSCFCSYSCKHEFAVMLQLNDILNWIEKNHNKEFNGYFAAIIKNIFTSIILRENNNGKFVLE